MLERVDRTSADIAAVEAKIDAEIAPSPQQWPGWMRSPASATPRLHDHR
jgi:hypothetical protein